MLNPYVTSPLLTKQARDMFESNVIVKFSRMGDTKTKTRCFNMRRSCTNKISGIVTHNISIVINILSITVKISSRVSFK